MKAAIESNWAQCSRQSEQQSKGPQVAAGLVCSEEQQGHCVAGAERVRGVAMAQWHLTLS